MSWYRKAKQVIALRKNMLRADIHVHAGDVADFTDDQVRNATIKSILSAAIIKGLDIIGIVAHDGPYMGQAAIQIASSEGLDLWVVSCQEYVCSDKIRIIAYNLEKPLPANMDYKTAAEYTHKNNGLIMLVDLTRRQAQVVNKFVNTSAAPDAIELYNAAVGWYMDIDIEQSYFQFMNSAAKSAKMLEEPNVYTLISRKDIEKLGFIPPGAGKDYVPKYLKRQDVADEQEAQQAAQAQPQVQGVGGNV